MVVPIIYKHLQRGDGAQNCIKLPRNPYAGLFLEGRKTDFHLRIWLEYSFNYRFETTNKNFIHKEDVYYKENNLRVMNYLEGPLSQFSTFVYRGSSHRRKNAACPKFEKVWYNTRLSQWGGGG
jgi:hypothetical protein